MHFILNSDGIIQNVVKCNLNSFCICQIFWSIIHAVDLPASVREQQCLVASTATMPIWRRMPQVLKESCHR